ncbi:MAG: hypothetical protein ACRD27_06320 [Terracidiphilus sp.]
MDLRSLIPYFWIFATAGAGAYLGAYLKRKGENLATKQDIGELTKTTEEIKAKISDDVWDRQKQWEMRRDAILEANRAMHELDTALARFDSAHRSSGKGGISIPPELTFPDRLKKAERCEACRVDFRRAKFVTDLVAGEEIKDRLHEYYEEAVRILNEIEKEDAAYFTPERTKAFADKRNEVTEAAQKELNINRV